MRAFKFLDATGCAPFTRTPWVEWQWVETARAEPCREGVHACAAADLSYWLAASLWEVELDGEITETRHKLAASRGRLVRRIDGYPAAVRELAIDGAERSRHRAIEILRAGDEHELADRVSGASLEQLAALRRDADEASFERCAAALAFDAARFTLRGPPPEALFVAACSAGHAAAGPGGDQVGYDGGYAAERAYQSAWLRDRLALG
jgi:hypothetical protein